MPCARAHLEDPREARPSDARRIGGWWGVGLGTHARSAARSGLKPATSEQRTYAPSRPQREGRSPRGSSRCALRRSSRAGGVPAEVNLAQRGLTGLAKADRIVARIDAALDPSVEVLLEDLDLDLLPARARFGSRLARTEYTARV